MANRSAFQRFMSILQRYGLYLIGITVGLGLPILATMIDIAINQRPGNLNGFMQAQSISPILWLVDLTAIFFIVLFLAGILRETSQRQKAMDLQSKISQRINEFYNLKEIYQQEIKDRQQAEIFISRAKREWETTFDAISDLILLTDSQSRIVRCNQATVKRLETTFSEVIGKPIEEVFPGVLEPIQKRVINKTQVIPMPSQFGWFEVTGFQFQLLDDEPGMIYIFRDIAQRKRDEAELQRQKQYFEAIFQNSPVAIITLDLNNRIVTSNPAFEHLFGYSQIEGIGKKLEDLILPTELRNRAMDYNQRLQRTGVFHEVSQRQTKLGVLVDVEVFNVPVVVKGEPLGTLVILYDISDLVQARRKAEDADTAKSAYLANISHEIRTPLNGLIGLLSLTLDTTLSSTQAEYLTTAYDQAEMLLVLLNQVLDLSKIEAGRMDLEFAAFDLRQVVENVALTMAQRAHDKDLELICSIPPSVPAQLRGDGNRLRQVLVNLTNNAVKFTDSGEVVINVRQISADEATTTLLFSVQDTGIGIPADQQESVFERYTQANPSTNRQFGGTGLGLSISAQLVELMGGRISLVSEPGLGSVFSFTLEFEKGEPNEPPPEELMAKSTGLRILLADLNENSRINLHLLLEELNCVCIEAPSPAEFSDLVSQPHLQENPFDLLIIDTQFANQVDLRSHPFLYEQLASRRVKLLVTTRLGDSIPWGLDQNGVDSAILLKPLRRQPLQNTVFELLSSGKTNPGEEKSKRGKIDTRKLVSASPQTILLAEDNSVNRKVVVKLLENFGHNVVAVENGREVLEALENNGFNLILMDVQMPEMDGLAASMRIRGQEAHQQHPPIIALTGKTAKIDIERFKSSGMDGHLTKPVRPQELFEAVERFAAPIPEGQPYPTLSAENTVESSISSSEEGVINELDFAEFTSAFDQLVLSTNQKGQVEQAFGEFEPDPATLGDPAIRANMWQKAASLGGPDYIREILPRFGNDLTFLQLTFDEFIQECRSHIAEIREAIEKQDATAVRLLGHNLKGLSANFEADQITTIARELEEVEGLGDGSRVSELASKIEEELPALEKVLLEIRTMF